MFQVLTRLVNVFHILCFEHKSCILRFVVFVKAARTSMMPCTCVSFQMGIMKLVSVSVNIFITSVRAGERYSDIFHTDIADVTHFVKPGTPLDEEAAIRGTTVYLVNKR